jgi:hypothetical protein
LALIVLGGSVVLIPRSPIPYNAVMGMVEGACTNVEILLEEFDARERAWYLPPREGRVFCFVPLVTGVKPAVVWATMRVPVRMLSEPMGVPGLMVFMPGSEILRLSQLGDKVGLEDAMVYVLVDYLEGAESVKAVREGNSINVFISRPRLRTDWPRFNNVLGSFLVCVLGCVAVQVLKAPVRVIEEKAERRGLRVRFEVLAAG